MIPKPFYKPDLFLVKNFMGQLQKEYWIFAG